MSTPHRSLHDSRRAKPKDQTLRPSFGRMLGRAFRRRCPWCGGEGWWRGWLKREERCRTCGYKYERQDGFALGAVTMNTIVTFGLIGLALLVGAIVMYPDLKVVPLIAICVGIALVVPIVFYPYSYTVWSAVDLTMRPLEPAEVTEAAAHAKVPEATALGRVPRDEGKRR